LLRKVDSRIFIFS